MGYKFPSLWLLCVPWGVLVSAAQAPTLIQGDRESREPNCTTIPNTVCDCCPCRKGTRAGLQDFRGEEAAEKGIQIIVYMQRGERAKIRSNATGTDRLKPDTLACVFLPLLV